MARLRLSRPPRVSAGGLTAAVDLTVLGLVLLVLLHLYSIAGASPLPFDPYLYRADGSRADPVNIVFESAVPGLDSATVAGAVLRALGWRDVQGEPMTFVSSGQAQGTARQFGLDLGGGARLHLRIAEVRVREGRTRVLAAVHRDETAACGHIGRGFDETRELVAGAFRAAGYTVIPLPLGNVASGRHCDGSLTPGDGVAIVVHLGG